MRYLAPLWQDIPRSAQGPRALWVWLRFVAFCISQFKSFGSSSKHAEIGPESFGIVVCRFVGTVPDILGLVWPSFRPKSGSKSKISGRILNNFRALLAQPSGLPAASGFGWSGAALESVFLCPFSSGCVCIVVAYFCRQAVSCILCWVPEGQSGRIFLGRKSVIWGVWAASGARESLQKCGGPSVTVTRSRGGYYYCCPRGSCILSV